MWERPQYGVGREKARENTHPYAENSTDGDGEKTLLTSRAALGLEVFTGSEVFPMKPGLRLHVDRKGTDWAGLPLDRLL